ncbi:alpha-L-fucosidase [Sphaerisporangium fuscum]|uniref:alpha-L-fucosidase n=1 Tax=Sphaerisporangium fuscum TaxID=2835868 RepID=UPI001BDD2AA7|nr:alpha-L-fucosidase [Sphaerisporangium fuscum]
MLLFDRRTGPDLGPDAPEYPDRPVPDWYRDAKFGVFVHWGLYSVAAWAQPRTPGRHVPVELEYSHHQYAEWYANTLRIPGSPTRAFHEAAFGVGTSYEDLADGWTAEAYDPEGWVRLFAECGARYVVPTAKHHDGFCLWDTATTPFTSVHRGPRRDVVADLAAAARAAGLRFGVYYSGALDWHVSHFPPIRSLTDLFTLRRNDPGFARYCFEQVTELVERHRPDVLWNDIEWPDSAKAAGPHSLAALFERYYDRVPEGVVNDRWGVPHLGYRTREYLTEAATPPWPWEATRGLGTSFGYNRAEDGTHLIGHTELVHLLVDTVAKNGNLLLNIGPRGDGSLPDDQVDRLRHLGRWLAGHPGAVYGTRPWRRHAEPEGPPLRYTLRPDGTLNVIALDPAYGSVTLAPDLRHHRDARWGEAHAEVSPDGTVTVPPALRYLPAAVLTLPQAAPD